MLVRVFGGISNRLRAVLSWKATFGSLDVVWPPDGEIANGRFEEVFEPLPGVTFHDWADYGTMTLDPYPHAPANWRDEYRGLRLRQDVLSRYHVVRPKEPYTAIHVRRTDHVHMATTAGQFTSDEMFRDWLKTASGPVYVATDNGTTQLLFRAMLAEMGREAIVFEPIPEHAGQDVGGQRNTTLAHAVIDLFMCAGAREFMGSGVSSFTTTVGHLRSLGGWWT